MIGVLVFKSFAKSTTRKDAEKCPFLFIQYGKGDCSDVFVNHRATQDKYEDESKLFVAMVREPGIRKCSQKNSDYEGW